MAQQQQKPSTSNSNESTKTSSPPYTHWIHCNRCYEQYINKARQFYLLACNHVCCHECIQNISETTVNGPQIYKCPMCGRSTRACKLGNDMPAHLKELFHPEPSLDGLNTYRIMMFQEKHRHRFMDHLDREYSAIRERKKEAIRIKEQAKKHYQELGELKTERKELEKRVIAINHQRKELEEKRKLRPSQKRSNSSDSTSHSSGSKTLLAPPAKNFNNSEGITSFTHHTSNHSFML
ncbi:RING finger protein vilya [Calliphora vicina]|uniref:RING finger protein vilya n=1 Tax=Calliphora vicina TaxID=7373 RepID=UPI00325C091A